MKFETKYNIGDEVYRVEYIFREDGKGVDIIKSTITGIGIYQNKQEKIKFNYYLDTHHGGSILEDELFETKKLALESVNKT